MAFNPIKEFFKRKKAEVKFSRAGPAHKLSSETEAPSSSQATSARAAAAEAAMKRYNQDPGKRPPAQRPRTSQPTKTPASVPEEVKSEAGEDIQPAQEELAEGQELDRKIQVFTLEELAQRIKAPDIDDDFFRMTIEDAKIARKRYEENRKKNEVLMTSEMRLRQAESKRVVSKVCRIRFKLPNSLVLESSFRSKETLKEIREWLIQTCLEKTGLELGAFDILLGHMPIKEKDLSKSALDAGLVPASTLTIVERQDVK